jgi:hypothetical protein
MYIRLKKAFADPLWTTGKVDIGAKRLLEVYQPLNPVNLPEVVRGTMAGHLMMEEYTRDKDRWYVGITAPYITDDHQKAQKVISLVTAFESKKDTIDAVTIKGVDVGFMPLQALIIRYEGPQSKLEIVAPF